VKKFLSLFLIFFVSVSYAADNKEAKINVSMIIKNGLILTMNKKLQVIKNGVIAVNGNKIVAVGSNNLLKKYSSDNIINAENGIVMPGMINAHTHAAMSVFRSIGDDVGDRLKRFLFPLEKQLVTPQLVYDGTLHGAVEMVKGGVTTMVDMYYFEDQAADAVKKIGMRGVMGETIMKNPTPDSQKPYGGIDYAVKFVKKYKNDNLITPAFAPHATYTNDTKHLKKVQELAEKYNVPIVMHVAETKAEVSKYKKEYNMTPVGYLDSIGLLSNHLIAAHCIFVNDDDINLL
jgi:5-methylthioadenosine/S-adenosylhomocysteine deaminase